MKNKAIIGFVLAGALFVGFGVGTFIANKTAPQPKVQLLKPTPSPTLMKFESVNIMLLSPLPTPQPTPKPTPEPTKESRHGKIYMIEDIKKVFDNYEIPLSVWLTIAMCESELNTGMSLENSIENSKGLFQINVQANEQFTNFDLHNPIVNADVAARYFINPALDEARMISEDPLTQALIVYSGQKYPYSFNGIYLQTQTDGVAAGIRPQWTERILNKFIKHYNTVIMLE